MLAAVVIGAVLVWWITLGFGGESSDSSAAPVAAPMPSEETAVSPAAPNTAPATQAATPSERPAPANTEASPNPSGESQASSGVPIPAPVRSGPVDELKRAFESEPRASTGARIEAAIEAQFRRADIPAGLLESVMCRTTVCRVETRWSPERAEGFMGAFMRLMQPEGTASLFDEKLAISPEADVGPDRSQAIDVYLKRAAASAPPVP
ncbi:MAG TPA: hypothetical protein VJR89_27310 [Polyangiales bacterium]|nr:hypothetical protein [Polyangiales bacterium]